MILENFKEAYKEIIDSIPVPDFCIEEIPENDRVKRIWACRRKRYMAAAALAGGIFVIYTLGGVVAASYAKNLARVDENSFQAMGMNTDLVPEETGTVQFYAEGISERGRAYTEEAYTETTDSDITEKLEDLEKAVEQKLCLPLEDGSSLIRLETEEQVLLLHQYYYENTSVHDLEAACVADVRNEGSYTTGQGFVYKMSYSPNGEEIHAVIAVGDYEWTLDFYGYTETEACEMLESIHITVDP